MPDSIIFVFPMFTRRPFFSISVFHVCTFTSSSSMDSALIIRSSAYSSSHGQPVRNSLDRASNTMMKSSWLRTEPWWTPTPTPNSSLYPLPTLTLLLTSLYMDWTRRTSHSSIPSLRFAHQMTSIYIDYSKIFVNYSSLVPGIFMNIHECKIAPWIYLNIINMNNHEYPWTKGDNYSDMQNPMQVPQLSTPKIISCI